MAVSLRSSAVWSSNLVFSVLCAGVAGWAFVYLFRDFEAGNRFAEQFARSGLDVPAHLFGGGVALLLSPMQLSTSLRRRWPRLHRIGGGLYTACVLVGGLAGLSLAQHAQGGWPSRVAFTLLAVTWLTVTTIGIAHAIARRHEAHRRWMWRSVALTASAITLRLTMGVGIGALHLPPLSVYVFAAWSCWTINLAVCELLLHRQSRSARGMPSAFRRSPA
ncbi:DUF2306 domain-containing protein [Lysobacter panacisoli]|uniref:DUF2306 domain-containing protein n=1 Tax=Lysobacter panacisoli TaxID=1255263 RepID=A0ABP9LQP7_9GAMM|nr:DUF2306 domain-containing protein [Lysobacter panacisoli]